MASAARTTAVLPCAACGALNRADLARVADKPKCGKCRAPLPIDQPLLVNDQNFDKVITGTDVPVLVDFYADWCGPCKMMEPVFAQFAQQSAGQVLVLKVDTESSRAIAQRFQIRGIPTLIALKGGREVAREVGAVPAQRLASLVAAARNAA